MRLLRRLADAGQEHSLARRLRRRRFELFRSLLAPLPRPLRILDVGGEQAFWETMGVAQDRGLEFVLLNVTHEKATLPNFRAVVGDACDLSRFADGEFDVAFSNSVIEHVGDAERQRRMASEVRRVGRAYFVQTPYRYFPVEPHFLFPFFQFLPRAVQVPLIRHLDLTYTRKAWTEQEARDLAASVRLLGERELRAFFPGARLYREKLFGLTKSLVVYGGFDAAVVRRPMRSAGT